MTPSRMSRLSEIRASLRHRLGQRWRGESGSEPASFALVMPLVLILVLGLLQLSLALWVRTTLIDAAGAGAHAAALAGAPESAADETVRGVLASTLGSGYVHTVSAQRVGLAMLPGSFATSDLEVMEVQVKAPMPIIGLFGVGDMTAVGHAVIEEGP
ncbi:TadE/TadG family type IV pilus assembly protein [Mobiluncus curtisii]|nr:TadE/TadG family type IV pilus assembly protein [Mobiluncus curtisii]